jgi:hypothetical protein
MLGLGDRHPDVMGHQPSLEGPVIFADNRFQTF